MRPAHADTLAPRTLADETFTCRYSSTSATGWGSLNIVYQVLVKTFSTAANDAHFNNNKNNPDSNR